MLKTAKKCHVQRQIKILVLQFLFRLATFHGEYMLATFWDLFIVIYVNNKKLSPVEKLYHLFQKSYWRSSQINQHILLTYEGFINQLKAIFNLPNGPRYLQVLWNNAIYVFKLYKIDIRSTKIDPVTLDTIYSYENRNAFLGRAK